MIKWAEQAHAGVVASLLTGGVCGQVVKTKSTFLFFGFSKCVMTPHIVRGRKQNMMGSKVALFSCSLLNVCQVVVQTSSQKFVVVLQNLPI